MKVLRRRRRDLNHPVCRDPPRRAALPPLPPAARPAAARPAPPEAGFTTAGFRCRTDGTMDLRRGRLTLTERATAHPGCPAAADPGPRRDALGHGTTGNARFWREDPARFLAALP